MASTGPREASRKDDQITAYQMGVVKINKGTFVSVRAADGYAYPSRSGTSTDIFVGVAYETIDNSGGSAGPLIRVYRTGSFVFLQASVAQTAVGSAAYASDDQTTTATSTNNQKVGTIVDVESATAVRVAIRTGVQ